MKFFNEYFVFSSSEKRGIFVFLLIIGALSVFYWMMPYLFVSEPTDFSKWEEKFAENSKLSNEIIQPQQFYFNPNTISVDSLIRIGFSKRQANNIVNYRNKVGKFKNSKDFKKLYSINDSTFNKISPFLIFKATSVKAIEIKKVIKSDSLFVFNPNTIERAELIQLGFSQKQANTLLNFRNKGGKFFKPEDLKKVYSVSDKLYQKLEPYIKIEKQEKPDLTPRRQFDQKKMTIPVNQCDAKEFEIISGIGPKLSVRIIKYRDKLGGFHSVHQLKEVYGLDSTIVNQNFQSFFIFPNEIKKININRVTFKELMAHPYFSYSTTKKIINFRDQHGDFRSVEEILENNLIKLEQYRKIAPYISIEK